MNFIGVNINERKGDDSDFVTFKLSEVNNINLYRHRKSSHQIPIYHTSHGSYAPLMTLSDLSAALTPHGFYYIDQSNLVNGNRVIKKEMVEEGLKLTFEDQVVVIFAKKSAKRNENGL